MELLSASLRFCSRPDLIRLFTSTQQNADIMSPQRDGGPAGILLKGFITNRDLHKQTRSQIVTPVC